MTPRQMRSIAAVRSCGTSAAVSCASTTNRVGFVTPTPFRRETTPTHHAIDRSHHDTQADAIDRGREIVRNLGGGELRIHDQQGRIRDSDTISPGNDPN